MDPFQNLSLFETEQTLSIENFYASNQNKLREFGTLDLNTIKSLIKSLKNTSSYLNETRKWDLALQRCPNIKNEVDEYVATNDSSLYPAYLEHFVTMQDFEPHSIRTSRLSLNYAPPANEIDQHLVTALFIIPKMLQPNNYQIYERFLNSSSFQNLKFLKKKQSRSVLERQQEAVAKM